MVVSFYEAMGWHEETCIPEDGELAKHEWMAMESATRATYKEQLMGHW